VPYRSANRNILGPDVRSAPVSGRAVFHTAARIPAAQLGDAAAVAAMAATLDRLADVLAAALLAPGIPSPAPATP